MEKESLEKLAEELWADFWEAKLIEKDHRLYDLLSQIYWPKALEIIMEKTKPRWISVKERYPHYKMLCVLVIQKNGDQRVALYHTIGSEYFMCRGEKLTDVTDWQALPEKPEETKQEKMDRLGITDQDISETMPELPKYE